jgi:hypothetical protein
MITREQAVELLRSRLPDALDIDETQFVEREYGWVFFSQSKNFLRDGDLKSFILGLGGTLVERATGRRIDFPSGFSAEGILHIYELGYLTYENWDIEITSVVDMTRSVDLLLTLDLIFVVPEEAYGEVWRIPQAYTGAQIRARLGTLPTQFNVGSLYSRWEILESFKSHNAFTYHLLPNSGLRNTP